MFYHPSPTTINFTEEAFLLNSLQEGVKIWGKGIGQASFHLQIDNGTADLQLGFKLGLPSDLHVVPPAPPDPDPQPNQHQRKEVDDQHIQNCGYQQQRRRKGPARRAKDRVRAAQHQACLQSKSAAPADIILPFNGKVIPIISSSTPASVSVASTPPAAKPSDTSSTPTKISPSATRMYVGVNTAKKQLFGAHSSATDPVASTASTLTTPSTATDPEASTSRRGFERREEQLWTKLFSI